MPHTDQVVITATIGDSRVCQLLVDEGSELSLLYLNFWLVMVLKDEWIIKDVNELADFNGSTSQPYRKIMLDITLHSKVISTDFYLQNYNSPNNGLLG